MSAYIYGSSDDLIEVEGTATGCDEYNAEHGQFVLTGRGGAVKIGVQYDGVWGISVAPLEEDFPMLPVTVRLYDNGYSAVAAVPDAETVVREAE